MTIFASDAPIGLWMNRALPLDTRRRMAAAAEDLGWAAVWTSGGATPGSLDEVRAILEATAVIPMGTSILNMWTETPDDVTSRFHVIDADHPGRLILGVGPSHATLVKHHGLGTYRSPYSTSEGFLEALAGQPHPVPRDRLMLSALGPRALGLARTRTAGTIPYLTVPQHTAFARETIGPHRIVAPELGVVLASDRAAGHDVARSFLAKYLALPNYTRTLLRHGMTAADLEGDGSDRLINELFGIGSAEDIAAAIAAHLSAGANHVAIQILALPDQDPVTVMTAIAEATAELPHEF
jgi:probable F420-dependent oxidoreductase